MIGKCISIDKSVNYKFYIFELDTMANRLEQARSAMRDAFRIFDTDKSGYIEKHELGLLLTKLTDSFHVGHPSDDDVNEVFKELDVNGDGKISQSEFDTLICEVVNIIATE